MIVAVHSLNSSSEFHIANQFLTFLLVKLLSIKLYLDVIVLL